MLDIVKVANRVIECSFYSLFFLVPLILTPWNHELFEFNKMMLVYTLTILIVGAWLVKMVTTKKFIFKRTFFDIPLIIFLTSQLLSFFFSVDRYTSFWGYYSRFHGGLASTICYLLLYWSFVSNAASVRKREVIFSSESRGQPSCFSRNGWGKLSMPAPHTRSSRAQTKFTARGKSCAGSEKSVASGFVVRSLLALLGSATIVSLYGIAEHFGIDDQYWVQDVQNRVFSTLGQPNWLAAWLVAIIPLTWSFTLIQFHGVYEKRKEKKPTASVERAKKPKKRTFQTVILNPVLNLIQDPIQNLYRSRVPSTIRYGAGKHGMTMYVLFTVYYLCLLYTKSRSGLMGFGIAYLVFWPLAFWLNRHRPKKILKPFLIFTFSFLIFNFLVGTPWTPSLREISANVPEKIETKLPTDPVLLISESGDIRKVVWQGALDVLKHYPLFGTGIETFAYSYYWYRPREHNDLSEWDFLYNKAHNEYLNFGATTGLVGLGAYLLVIGSFVGWYTYKLIRIKIVRMNSPNKSRCSDKKFGLFSIRMHSDKKVSSKNQADRILVSGLLTGYASIIVTNLFGFSVVPVALLFFLYPALAALTHSRLSEYKTSQARSSLCKTGKRQWFVIAAILLFTFYFLLVTYKYWCADFLFAKGEKLYRAGVYDQAYYPLQRAIGLRPKEPFYHNELALVLADLAVLAQGQENEEFASQWAKKAISESDKTLKVSPYHLNFWKNRTQVFYKLAEIDESYYQGTLASLLRAAELAPTDAKIAYNLALLYARIGQDQTAIKTLEQTIRLKPNYADARYALALFYEKEEKMKEAKQQLEYILEKINPQHEPAREKLEELLEY